MHALVRPVKSLSYPSRRTVWLEGYYMLALDDSSPHALSDVSKLFAFRFRPSRVYMHLCSSSFFSARPACPPQSQVKALQAARAHAFDLLSVAPLLPFVQQLAASRERASPARASAGPAPTSLYPSALLVRC